MFLCALTPTEVVFLELHRTEGWRHSRVSPQTSDVHGILKALEHTQWIASSTFHIRLLLFDISNDAPCADEMLRALPVQYEPFHALLVVVETSRLPAKWMREMKQLVHQLGC